ncbi:Retrovirus-related Pol poly from transposon [Paramuricea clavata]|uniref:Retrovirus-related Pol poly from transposon n=1 Tax=Paramuricea clavata TaxID=317549 RepID=A0A7D9J6Z6_PARCT|nr:Retrovirus-related Pol poly from transposon [Paramuricea clavata]
MVNEIAKYRVFSTIDLRSAYHQLPLKDEDKPYTAFEARNGLYQFTRLPFGVTNGVACFQREMVKLVEQHALNGVFPYLDNITICGKDQEDHDENLERFLEAAKCKNVCYNDDKSIFSTRCLPLLGYLIEEGNSLPDPERLRPLRDHPFTRPPTVDPRVL